MVSTQHAGIIPMHSVDFGGYGGILQYLGVVALSWEGLHDSTEVGGEERSATLLPAQGWTVHVSRC